MSSVKNLEFKSSEDHNKWISDNRRTGLREISCSEYYGVIKIEYIELF